MAQQTVTLTIPQALYDRIAERAKQANRPMVDETLSTLEEKYSEPTGKEIDASLEYLKNLPDEELWQRAKWTATDDQNEEMQVLLEKQQREGLTTNEKEQVELLSAYFNKIMLTRAYAVEELVKRGHNISNIYPNR